MRYLVFLPFLGLLACGDTATSAATDPTPDPVTSVPPPVTADEAESIPPDELIARSTDINDDGQVDNAVAVTLDTDDPEGFGKLRRLEVYSPNQTDAWYTATGVLLPTEHGGMMGDPLDTVYIDNGAIVVSQAGGSRSRWGYTHYFRWDGQDFTLAAVYADSGVPCELMESIEYDLTTGSAVYAKTRQACGEFDLEETVVDRQEFTVPVTQRPSMKGFQPGETALAVPGTEATLYY